MKDSNYRLCVGLMLFNAQGKILVGKRVNCVDGALGWQMPQGGVEGGETTEEACYREGMEELGTNNFRTVYELNEWLYYDIPEKDIPKHWNKKYIGQKQKWYLLYFKGHDDDININTENPEFSSWKWMEIYELPNNIVHFKKAIYEKLVKEFTPTVQDFCK